jgi:signal peptidase I
VNNATRIRHSEYFKSAVVIIVILGVFLGLLFGLGVLLNVSVRVVESGSMCVSHPYGACNGWVSLNHPFNQTLHKGDIIIIQGVNPADLNTNYPNSDIIVYQRPDDPSATPIVHRIVSAQEIDGKLYFQTKGDGNQNQPWPAIPSPDEYDSVRIFQSSPNGVFEDLVLGRVVMRIPYFGHVTLFLNAPENSWALPVIIALILLLIVVEFVIPILRKECKIRQTNPVKL